MIIRPGRHLPANALRSQIKRLAITRCWRLAIVPSDIFGLRVYELVRLNHHGVEFNYDAAPYLLLEDAVQAAREGAAA